MAVGCFGAAYYVFRLATRNPDVMWNRKANPNPNEEYRNKQYKVRNFHISLSGRKDRLTFFCIFSVPVIPQFYSPVRDYTNIDSPAPKYDK